MFFRKWHPTYSEMNTLPSIKSLTKVSHEPGKRGVRRIAVLNKLFMKHITDLMSTGSSGLDIVGRGIEISKVYCLFYMYYKPSDKLIEKLKKKYQFYLHVKFFTNSIPKKSMCMLELNKVSISKNIQISLFFYYYYPSYSFFIIGESISRLAKS